MSSANLRGIILMVVSMALFTVADLNLKFAAREIGVGQVMLVMGLGSGLVFWIMMQRSGERLALQPFLLPAVVLRNIGDLLGVVGMCIALAYVPLSLVAAVIQIVPLMLTAAAALFLGERVGLHRSVAVLLGFAGVILIIRPGVDGFDSIMLMPLVAATGLTIRDIGTKLVGPEISSVLLSFYSACLITFAGLVTMMITGTASIPDMLTSLYCLVVVLAGSAGYLAMTAAVRLGEMSVISPFRYSRLLFAMVLGVLVLGETIASHMVVGTAMTIAAGLYIWHREALSVRRQ